MGYESKKRRLTKLVATKVHEYNAGKHTDLIAIGDDLFKLKSVINNQISAIERRYKRNIVIRTALKYNKLIFSEFELDARISMYKHMVKGSYDDAKENLELYTKLREEVDRQYDEAIRNDTHLTRLKYRFHSVMWLYTNPHYKQITKSPDSPYDGLKLTQLLEMFDSKSFYKLSEREVIDLCQAVANKYCTSMGIRKLPVIFEYEKYNDAFGKYSRFGNYVLMNGEYLTIINKLRENGSENKYLQYKLLQTVIHECRHSFQAMNTRADRKSTYIRNCAHINMHYMHRIYNPQHIYDETYNRYGYMSRIIELDAQNEANQFLLDVSLLRLKNATEIRRYVLASLPEKYKAENSVIKEMRDLIANYGLPHGLSKSIYENMKILGLTHSRCVVTNGDKIDYRLTNENNYHNLNSVQMRLALGREELMRKEYFPTLFDSATIIETEATKQDTPVDTYRQELQSGLQSEREEVKIVSAQTNCFLM